MVGTPRRCRARWLMVASCAGPLAGCAVVPKSRLDECHQLSRNLQAQNAQLKDKELGLRSQNQDLAQRAVDDALRLKLRDEEVERLTQSVHAYQQEREQLAAAVERIRRQFQSAGGPLSSAQVERFRAFAASRPGCEFDPGSGGSTFEADRLFAPSSDRLKPEALALLRAYAGLLRDLDAKEVNLLVVGHAEDAGVRRASLQDRGATGRHLSLDRASRVREALAAEAGIDPSRIDVAGFEEAEPDGDSPRSGSRRIEIRVRRRNPPAAEVAGEADGPTVGPGLDFGPRRFR